MPGSPDSLIYATKLIVMSEAKMEKKKEKSQSERFKQAAKDVGADESEAAFEEKLRKIAKAKPKKNEA